MQFISLSIFSQKLRNVNLSILGILGLGLSVGEGLKVDPEQCLLTYVEGRVLKTVKRLNEVFEKTRIKSEEL
jgi:hypothetical protein